MKKVIEAVSEGLAMLAMLNEKGKAKPCKFVYDKKTSTIVLKILPGIEVYGFYNCAQNEAMGLIKALNKIADLLYKKQTTIDSFIKEAEDNNEGNQIHA